MGMLAAFALPHPPLIVPGVGKGLEGKIATTVASCEEVARRAARLRPTTVVVSSPHAPAFVDGFWVLGDARAEGSMAAFGAPDETVRFDCDEELARAIVDEARASDIAALLGHTPREGLDHASFIPLWFLERAWRSAGTGDLPQVVCLGISGLSLERHRELGAAVARCAARLGRDVVWLASGDLSHRLREDGPYGFDPAGPLFDERVCAAFEGGDLEALFHIDEGLCRDAAECGLRSFALMAGALDGLPVSSELLSHEDLGVGYGVAAFEDAYLSLARWAVGACVAEGRPVEVPAWAHPALLSERAGVFVSLHAQGELRGCIGTIAPTRDSVAAEIVRNAYAASHEDPRFRPVAPEELAGIDVSVDVLGRPEPAEVGDLDPRRYGAIVTKGWRRGLLLPDLEGVDTVERQLAIARAKAGIAPEEDGVEIERFEVVRHGRA